MLSAKSLLSAKLKPIPSILIMCAAPARLNGCGICWVLKASGIVRKQRIRGSIRRIESGPCDGQNINAGLSNRARRYQGVLIGVIDVIVTYDRVAHTIEQEYLRIRYLRRMPIGDRGNRGDAEFLWCIAHHWLASCEVHRLGSAADEDAIHVSKVAFIRIKIAFDGLKPV